MDLFLFRTISFIYGQGDDNLARYRLINKQHLNPLTRDALLCTLLPLWTKSSHVLLVVQAITVSSNCYKTTERAVSAQWSYIFSAHFKNGSQHRNPEFPKYLAIDFPQNFFSNAYKVSQWKYCKLKPKRPKLGWTTVSGWIKAQKSTFVFSHGRKIITCSKISI